MRYTNPSSDAAHVTIRSETATRGQLLITGMDVRNYGVQTFRVSAGIHTVPVNCGGLAPGLYSIRIDTESDRALLRLVKE